MTQPIVIKVSGDYVEKAELVTALAKSVAGISKQQPCIMVHGGGRAIDEWLKKAGIQPNFHNGLRVTDEATLEIAEMVLSGLVNKRLVTALLAEGVDALGMSGVDRGMIRVEPVSAELGRVGQITSVRDDVLRGFVGQGVTPVISPISIGVDGRYNVNADHAAGAVACAVEAARAIFLTNVPGVLVDGSLAERLSAAETHRLIETGVISGGMIPKVTAALDALESGAAEVMIADLDGLAVGRGTVFVK